MRRRSLTGQYSSSVEPINVTPLIDVVMCLIIFFLIVGKLVSDRGVPVRLPQTGVGQDETSPLVMTITITQAAADAPRAGWNSLGIAVQADGETSADARALEQSIRGRLAEQPALSVQIRADRDLSYGVVEPVLRAAGNAGAKSVRLATERLP